MGMFAHHFNGESNVQENVSKNIDQHRTNGEMIMNDKNESATQKEHHDPQAYNNQVYISLQSPSREENPITSFVKPPDFISLKPLTQDEEKAILMQVKELKNHLVYQRLKILFMSC